LGLKGAIRYKGGHVVTKVTLCRDIEKKFSPAQATQQTYRGEHWRALLFGYITSIVIFIFFSASFAAFSVNSSQVFPLVAVGIS
jgi:hypothetical protein